MEAVHEMKRAKLFPEQLEREVQLERDAQELELQHDLEQHDKDAAALLEKEQHDKDAASGLEDLPPLCTMHVAASRAREKHDLLIQKKQIVLTERREELEELRAAKVLGLQEARALEMANEHGYTVDDQRPPLKRKLGYTVGESSSSSSLFQVAPCQPRAMHGHGSSAQAKAHWSRAAAYKQ
jgi:membrane-bound lytic murein transglycosylase MltF